MNCIKCGHSHTIKNGTFQSKKSGLKQNYKCMGCHRGFSIPIVSQNQSTLAEFMSLSEALHVTEYIRDDAWIENILESNTFVITSAQSSTPINDTFFNALKHYCLWNDAQLMIIPNRYRNPTAPDEVVIDDYPAEIEQYLFENNIRLHEKLKVLGQLKIAATAEYPLTGLAPISKGDSVIFGHGQLQMATLPVQVEDHPVIMTTTGSISEKNYSSSKQGYKAEFNHSQSAVVVELDGATFHIRHLNFDGVGFFDFDQYYSKDGIDVPKNPVTAIVTGDEHAVFFDEEVKEATYGEKGIVALLKPKFIIRHDVLDCYSISHHHKHNFLTKYKKFVNGNNDIADELEKTVAHVVETTPTGCTNVMIQSNHTDHLTKWLNECDIKLEPWNARIYHWLMYNMLSAIDEDPSMIPDPFEAYSTEKFENEGCLVEFLNRSTTYKLHDIELAVHGDVGINGSRGSRQQFSKLPAKTIIGHSHSPGIEKGCWQVGTSSILNLEYNLGPSSWMQTHCLIYSNGKRQLINIINGKWRV